MESLGEYLLSFVDKFFFWIGLVMLILDLLEKYMPKLKKQLDKLLPHWAFVSLAALCLFIASFQAWREEHEKVQQQATFMEFDLMHAPLSPNSRFLAGEKTRVNFGLHNQGKFLAEDFFAAADLVIRKLDHKWNPRNDEALPTSIAMEDGVFDQFKTEKADDLKEPRSRQTVDPESWGFGSAHTDSTLTLAEQNSLHEGTSIMYLVGFVEWRDGSGTHEKRICRIVQPPADGAQATWEPCKSYNDFLPRAKD